jgi:hypothetical protein
VKSWRKTKGTPWKRETESEAEAEYEAEEESESEEESEAIRKESEAAPLTQRG